MGSDQAAKNRRTNSSCPRPVCYETMRPLHNAPLYPSDTRCDHPSTRRLSRFCEPGRLSKGQTCELEGAIDNRAISHEDGTVQCCSQHECFTMLI